MTVCVCVKGAVRSDKLTEKSSPISAVHLSSEECFIVFQLIILVTLNALVHSCCSSVAFPDAGNCSQQTVIIKYFTQELAAKQS